jgi:hypothetical protein
MDPGLRRDDDHAGVCAQLDYSLEKRESRTAGPRRCPWTPAFAGVTIACFKDGFLFPAAAAVKNQCTDTLFQSA